MDVAWQGPSQALGGCFWLSGCQMLCQVTAAPPRQRQQVAVSVCQQTAGSVGALT